MPMEFYQERAVPYNKFKFKKTEFSQKILLQAGLGKKSDTISKISRAKRASRARPSKCEVLSSNPSPTKTKQQKKNPPNSKGMKYYRICSLSIIY
jgi:hypothetical protein